MLARAAVYPRRVIRDGGEADFAAATELMNALSPHRVGSAAGLLYAARAEPPAARRRFWAADVDGALVGWGTAIADYESTESAGLVNVAVAREHWGRGIGSSLLEACLDHVAEIGADLARGRSESDEHSRGFALARGFVQTHAVRVSAVDPRTVAPPVAREGVELVPLGTVTPEAAFELDVDVSADVPNEQLDAVELEQWVADHWRHPDRDLDASTALLVDGELVACSYVRITADGRSVTDFTGTRREHRGRGLAEAVKRATLVKAAARSATIAVTHNDSTNAAMLRVNERLGYRPLAELLAWSRPSLSSGR